MSTIRIAKDYTNKPGPRTKAQGEYSGQRFREELLRPQYLEAKRTGEKLVVDLDGAYGYVTAFLEEAFGGLKRDYPDDNILDFVEVIGEEQPGRVDRIKSYIANALNVNTNV